MSCYRTGGCGPYENRSCSECPASKPEYAERNATKPINVKVFLNEDGVMCVLADSNTPIEIEIIDSVAIECEARDVNEYDEEDDPTDAYINQLCGDGYVYVPDENISVTNMLYEE